MKPKRKRQMAHKAPVKLSNRELKRIYASSLRLTADIDPAQIREMIRRGFFRKGIWLDELDVLESVAKEILNHRDERGRTVQQIDPLLWGHATEIVDLGAKVPFTERHTAPDISLDDRPSGRPLAGGG